MLSKIANWMREHLLKTVMACLAVGGGSGWGVFTVVEQSRLDRFEERMLEEYQKVETSRQAVSVGLDQLSFALATADKSDAELVKSLGSELVRMYTTLDVFKVGMDVDQREKIEAWQSALTDLKVEIQKTSTRNDLQYLATRFVEVKQAYDNARPVLEERIGVPLLKS